MEAQTHLQPDVTVKFVSICVKLTGKNRLGEQNKALLLMRSPGSQVTQSSPDSPHSSTLKLASYLLLFFFFVFYCTG